MKIKKLFLVLAMALALALMGTAAFAVAFSGTSESCTKDYPVDSGIYTVDTTDYTYEYGARLTWTCSFNDQDYGLGELIEDMTVDWSIQAYLTYTGPTPPPGLPPFTPQANYEGLSERSPRPRTPKGKGVTGTLSGQPAGAGPVGTSGSFTFDYQFTGLHGANENKVGSAHFDLEMDIDADGELSDAYIDNDALEVDLHVKEPK